MKLLCLEITGGWLQAVAMTPEGQQLVVGQGTSAVTVWDIVALPDVGASTAGLLSSAHAPGALLAVCALYRGRANALSGREFLNLKGHNSAIRSVAVSPDGQRLATASDDGTGRVWDLASSRATRTLPAHTNVVSSVAVTRDGKRIVTGSYDGTARVWDIASGQEPLRLEGHAGEIAQVVATPDEKRIIAVDADGKVWVWDAVSGRRLLNFQAHPGPIYCVAVTPNGQRVVTVTSCGSSKVWDIASGAERLELNADGGVVTTVAVTPDGRRIVTGGNDRTARLWDAVSGRELSMLPAGTFWSVAVTPDSRRVILGLVNGTATVWDIAGFSAKSATPRELFSLQGHNDWIQSIAVTPDGQRIITGSQDRTVRVWDAVTGRQLLVLKGHTRPVRSVAVTPDGQRIITGSADGTVKIWEAASPEQVARWKEHEQEAARRLAAWQRPDAGTGGLTPRRSPGFIQDWLVLAPLKLDIGETAVHGANHADPELEREHLQGEAGLQPRAGDRVPGRDPKILWKAYHSEEPILDFNRLVGGRRTVRLVAYAVCYVISERERDDLLLQVGCEDQAKVYLNGQEVYKDILPHLFGAMDRVGTVRLRKGTNVLVLKVRSSLRWLGCARFVERDGNPVNGLQVRLVPE
jgi:WD40 repeat protein